MGELFVKNVPPWASHVDLKNFIEPYFDNVGVHTFHCTKQEGKNFATITLYDTQQLQTILTTWPPISPNYKGRHHRGSLIIWEGQYLQITRGKRPASDLRLKSLRFEEEERVAKQTNHGYKEYSGYATGSVTRVYPFRAFACGVWTDVQRDQTCFSPQFTSSQAGVIVFGRTLAAVLIGCNQGNLDQWQERIDIPYSQVHHVAAGLSAARPALTLSLEYSPRFVKPKSSALNNPNSPLDPAQILARLTLAASDGGMQTKGKQRKMRVPSLTGQSEEIAATCFVYQLTFAEASILRAIGDLLNRNRGLPSSRPINTPHEQYPITRHSQDLEILQSKLANAALTGKIPFRVRFQAEKLAVNGLLPPRLVDDLLGHVAYLSERFGANATANALYLTGLQVPPRNPSVDGNDYRIGFLTDVLSQQAASFREEGSIYDLKNRHDHVALIHRVTVTPAGLYLEGPYPEVKNRVIRRYEDHLDMFLRVTFADEDGEQLRSSNGSTDVVLWDKFLRRMNGAIKICGHLFTFLGFSHSSLRTQTCWFTAPFVQNVSLFHAQEVIKALGDFTSIRTPAKCAARIGQAFSDTTASVLITDKTLHSMADVERNSRCFSDGCGTISLELLRKVWKEYKIGGNMKPTLLQIRLGGAKGMVSLDIRLPGKQVCLRPSMVKFEASGHSHLEVCGGNLRPLPMYLNRQFIKILEDLGVAPAYFLELQSRALRELEMITTSAVNAANYLEREKLGGAQQLPNLLRLINSMGLTFTQDNFLRNCIDLAALIQLRDLKYRARIPLTTEQGVTLYGVMDETGYLEEGQIYCVTETRRGGRLVLTGGRMAITRAPAMHPGDIQIVEAVDIPDDSPLNALHNCVVFSSKGERDLPSMLSGGDLDGDLFNVIYDPQLLPKVTYVAADYPRVPPLDLGRIVEKQDITKFFIEFMESDKLGTISNIHQQVADRYDEGTLHPTCVKLAELASIAVDFSKTGIPVQHGDIPKIPDRDIWPDFMAPGPRVEVTSYGPTFEDEKIDPREKDFLAQLDPSMTRKYVRSEKVLGQLYRKIDERRFFDNLRLHGNITAEEKGMLFKGDLMATIWQYVQVETAGFQYEHLLTEATDIKGIYDSNMLQIMQSHSTIPSHPITELEVFSGAIVGKSTGSQSKQVRENNKAMRERFDRDVLYTREAILHGLGGEDEDGSESLARAMACFKVSFLRPNEWFRYQLESFKYVAAEVCLKEIWKLKGQRLRRIVPRVSSIAVNGVMH